MLRPYRARGVLLASLLLATGCQDYNFNPVGHCVIQPGTRRVTLSNVSSADVLFVVDESGSMGGEQAALATNFDRFVTNLNKANLDRATAGLDPIDFHLAVTTTSVFWNEVTSNTCRTDCTGAAGQPVCCMTSGAPVKTPKRCAGAGDACPVAGTSCRLDCATLQGEYHCCQPGGAVPPEARTEVVPCALDRVGTTCGTFETHYRFQGCTSNVSANEYPYPRGDFVSNVTTGTPNPRVVHFDKSIYPTAQECAATPPECAAGERCVPGLTAADPRLCRKLCTAPADCGAGNWKCLSGACEPTNAQGFDAGQLVSFFRQNVQVGTCGSGEEQALQAGRLALQKALAGQQRDSYDAAGTRVWTAPDPTHLPGSAPARWPNPNSKVVLVFVGDEDDCSSPPDPAGGVVMLPENAGADACVRDGLDSTPAAIRKKQYAVEEFVDYFTSLGRTVAAGFILPAAQNSCTLDSCTTSGLCCGVDGSGQPLTCSNTVGAQAPGTRLLETAKALSQATAADAKVEVVAGSICDPSFGTILDDIAEIVKPPSGLELPSVPAEDDVTLLRIGTSGGETRKLCSRPAPGGRALEDLVNGTNGAVDPQTGRRYDWWFTLDGNPGGSVAASQFVYINPKGSCIANPGETYSADYLGRLPEGGCWDSGDYAPVPGKETSGDAMCRAILGGAIGSWTCFTGPGPAADTCAPGPIPQTAVGTCICGGRTENCRNDPPPP